MCGQVNAFYWVNVLFLLCGVLNVCASRRRPAASPRRGLAAFAARFAGGATPAALLLLLAKFINFCLDQLVKALIVWFQPNFRNELRNICLLFRACL